MDDFKKYMQQHADEMDLDEPREAVWKNIAEKTKKPKWTSNAQMNIRLAAAACFIVLAASVFLLVTKKQKELVANRVPQQIDVTTGVQATIQHNDPMPNDRKAGLVKQTFEKPATAHLSIKKPATEKREQAVVRNDQHQSGSILQNIESNFSQLVSVQLNKVRSLPLYAEGPEYYSEFKKQFQQLEEDEKQMKKVISKDGISNENLENLINVCQQKLNLLKLLQNEINKTNSRYRQNNNSDTTNQINHINI